MLFSVFNTFGKYPQPDCDVMVYDVTDQWLNPDNSAHLIRIGERMEIPGERYHIILKLIVTSILICVAVNSLYT